MHLRKIFLLAVLLFIRTDLISAGDNKWTPIGPYGGHFFNFTFHPANPAIIFASGYRSIDGGSNWQRMDFPAAVLRISSKPPYTIYSVDINLSGLYRSDNAGITWQKISKIEFAPDLDEFDIELHPSNPNVIYIAEREFETGGHFFKSTDGGRTWRENKTGLAAPRVFPQLEVDPQRGTLYLLADKGTYVSQDGGQSWKFRKRFFEVHTWSESKLILDPARPNILYLTEDERLFRSVNAAQSWEASPISENVSDISIGPKGLLYVAKDGRAFRSINDGASFTLLPTLHLPVAQIRRIAVHPLRPNIVFASAFIDGIQRSTNSGDSWQISNRGATELAIRDLDISRDGMKFLAATGNDFSNHVLLSKDGGKNWNPINKRASQALIHPRDSNLFVLQNENIILSKDGGVTWKQIHSPYEKSAYLIVLDPNNTNVIYAALEFHNERTDDPLGLIKTTNQGASWQKINTGLDRLGVQSLIVSSFDSNLLFAASSGSLSKSTNGGRNWQKITSAGYARFITGDLVDPDRFYALGNDNLLTTTDAGKTWNSKPLQGIKEQISKIVVDQFRPSTLYAQGSVTYVSVDRGETWSVFDLRGLPSNENFHGSPTNPNVFYANTNAGIFSYTRTLVSGGPIVEQVLPNPAKPGEVVTIFGRNFGATAGTVMLGKNILQPSSWTTNKIAVTLPADVRTAQILVTANGKRSNQPEILILPPASTDVYPSNGQASGGTRVLIRPRVIGFYLFGKTLLFGRTVARNAVVLYRLPNSDDEVLILCTSPPGSGVVSVSDDIDSFGTFQYR